LKNSNQHNSNSKSRNFITSYSILIFIKFSS